MVLSLLKRKHTAFRWVGLFLLLIGFGLNALPLQAAVPSQESKTLEWQRLDTDISVQQNGDLRIVERNVIRFTSGTFTFGFRDIQQNRLTDIREINVTEGSELGAKLQFETTTSDAGDFRIKYFFAKPARNEVRTFTLAYTVSGAVRYYEGGDQVWWAGVYSNRNGFPVNKALITVNLPNGAKAMKAETYGIQAQINSEGGDQAIVAEATVPIPSGKEFEIRVQFPHGVISGAPAAWQQEFDAQQTYDQTERPRNDLLALLLGLVTMVGGPALAWVTWVTKGRDPNVGLVAEYLNTPPTGITPGVAGTLIDEKADMQDIIATLIDLARRGVIHMQETKHDTGYANDFIFSAGPHYAEERGNLQLHESRLLDALNLNNGERQLSTFKSQFFARLPGIKNALYKQLENQSYYIQNPEATRNKWTGLASGAVVLAGVLGCAGTAITASLTNYAVCVPIGLGLTAISFLAIARAMPVRTRGGADMRMRLEAFKRYLSNIEKYVNLKEATELFDKYLPFAIAFGIDRTYVKKFADVQTPAPPWYVPYYPAYGNAPYYPSRGSVGSASRSAGGMNTSQRGDVSEAAQAVGSGRTAEAINTGMVLGLAAINSNLTGMFTRVGNTFSSTPAPAVSSGATSSWSSGGSSSSWSGGGGSSGGGSSGGGGGGFG